MGLDILCLTEESYTIPTQEKSTTQDVSPKDVQPEDHSEKPIVTVAKPKYRLVQISDCKCPLLG